MKVLHLISGGDTGGAKTHILSLFKGLDKLIDAKIICFIEDIFYEEAREAGIDIEVFEQKGRADLSVVKRIGDEIKREGYDIVHCHGARANFIAFFLKFHVDIPFITTVHSDYRLDFQDNWYKRIIYTGLNTFALKRFNNFIAVSDTFKDMLIERGFKEEEIYVVYNGIDLEQEVEYTGREEFFKKYDINWNGETVIGIMARLDGVKDHKTFLKAAKKSLDSNPELIFLIAGEGAEKENLKEYAEELGILEKVYFLGHIKDVYSFLNAIDINTLTSISESFPYAVLEGAYMEKPIISTKVGGLVKLIDNGKNGYLVEVGDYEEISNKILELAQNKDKIKEMGKKLYLKVEKYYSSEKMGKDHVEIYKKILKADNKGASDL